jgi:hypothetical protein
MITSAIIPRTTQAALVCEPKNRDRRPSRCGSLRSRMTVKVARPHSTPTEKKSSRNPIAAQWPIPGIANVRENRSPYASMIVSSKTMKPQKVAAWAAPGTDHFSSFRCPMTSVSCVRTSPGTCSLAYSSRSGAGCPDRASRLSHHSRRPATASAATVSARPMIIRKTTRNLLRYLGVKRNGVVNGTQGHVPGITYRDPWEPCRRRE